MINNNHTGAPVLVRTSPNVQQMLEIGKSYGLHLMSEAYGHYMNRSDQFFLKADYHSQHHAFVEELIALGFAYNPEPVVAHNIRPLGLEDSLISYLYLRIDVELTIDDALMMLRL